MDYSLSGSSVHGISQARILEWIAISFSRRSSWSFWTRGLNWHLLHWQAGSLPLSHQGSPNLVLVSSKSYSDIRTWMQGVSLGPDPRKTSEEVRKWEREARPTKGVFTRRVSLWCEAHCPLGSPPVKGLISQLDKDMLKTQYCPIMDFQRKWPLSKGTTTTQWQIAVPQTSKSYKLWISNFASKNVS